MPTLICVSKSANAETNVQLQYKFSYMCNPDEYSGNNSGDNSCSPDDSCWPD